jgi:hypothetical protein
MEGSCSTGQRPQRAVVPVEEGEDIHIYIYLLYDFLFSLKMAFLAETCR